MLLISLLLFKKILMSIPGPNNRQKTRAKMYILYIFIISFFLISSCSIHGSFQGLYSYYSKTQKIAPTLIQKPSETICTLSNTETPVVYAINGRQLKTCIEKDEKALLYIWRPKCSSSICISPKAVQDICNENKIELYIVAEYYDYQTMTISYPTNKPIFGVDCEYYSTELTKKYISLFLKDLAPKEHDLDDNFYFLFQNGCLTSASDRLENITFWE